MSTRPNAKETAVDRRRPDRPANSVIRSFRLGILTALCALLAPVCALAQNTTAGNLTVQQTVKLTGDLTPAQLTAQADDYSPTGLATAAVLRLSSDASRTITGLAGGADGRVLFLLNVGSSDIVLAHESASSTAANRFSLGSGVTLTGGGAGLLVVYDATASRWRALGGTGSGGGGGSGTVTSVGLSLPAIFSVSGSPVTSSGTLTAALATQSANLVWAGPGTGSAAAPTFRSLVANDIPSLTLAKISDAGALAALSAVNNSQWSGTDLAVTNGGTGASTAADARINLGLVIGTDVQAYDADLTTWAGLTPSANAQSLVTAANYAAMRALLDLEPGTDVEAFITAGTTGQYWRGDKSWQTLNATAVGLGNVTNHAQTQAAVVPNTSPSAGQILVGNAGGTAYAPVAMSGDIALSSTGAATIQANSVALGTDTTGDYIATLTGDSEITVSGAGTEGRAATLAIASSIARDSELPATFGTIAIAGQSDVVADSTTDTLTLVAGSNITLTTNAGTDTITIAASGVGGDVTEAGDNAFTGTNTTAKSFEVARTDLAGGTSLTVNTHYQDTISANRTLTFSGTPAEGSTISLKLLVSAVCTLTIPGSKRLGEANASTTSLPLTQGNHYLAWLYIDGEWTLADTVGLLHNLAASAAPTANDDSGDGYAVGSVWIDTTNDNTYIATDVSSGAANWEQTNGGGGGMGYVLSFAAGQLTTVADATTYYVGNLPGLSPPVVQGRAVVYVPKAGTLKVADVQTYAATAGDNTSWTFSVSVNGGTPTSIQSLSASTNVRRWTNNALSIAVAVGDYIELVTTTPTWTTNPATLQVSGTVYIE